MGEGSRDFSGDKSGPGDDIELARKAVVGDEAAREAVSRLVHPLIHQQTKIFCKRYCHDNHFHAHCTLFPEWGSREMDASLCDWGNHCYAWMLEDLTHPERLLKFNGENGARLSTYFYAIVHSLPFNERWKDWRFGRRIRIPEYIEDIAPLAGKIFFWLIDQRPIEWMAQEARESMDTVEMIAERIIGELASRGRLYLLNSPTNISLTDLGSYDDEEDEDLVMDVPDCSWDPGKEQLNKKIAKGWNELNTVEQFVLEAMLIEDRDAKDVLSALVQNGITIREGVPPEMINIQQVFHFKRVTLKKLTKLSGLTGE